MREKSGPRKAPAERVVRDIRRATRRHFSAEDKIPIVLGGLRGEDSVAELCRQEGIVQNLYYRWSKDFLEVGKKCFAGDTARAAKPLLAATQALRDQPAVVDKRARIAARQGAVCRRLMTMPGVGAIVALTYPPASTSQSASSHRGSSALASVLPPDTIKAARPTAAAPSAEPVMLPSASLCSKRHT